jgi:hypothetical protein
MVNDLTYLHGCLQQYESTTTSAAPLAPNALLGTCFDEAWVQSVESALSISSTDRGYGGDKVNPFLHKALEQPRFWVPCAMYRSMLGWPCTDIGPPSVRSYRIREPKCQ